MTDFDTVRERLEAFHEYLGGATTALAALDRIEQTISELHRIRQGVIAESERWERGYYEEKGLREELEAENERLRRIEEAARAYVETLDHSDLYENPKAAKLSALEELCTALEEK